VHPVLGTKRFHAGMDLGVFSGTSIYALADGEVIFSGWMSGYGNVIMVDHGSLVSLYAHNSSLIGQDGQKVKGGQLIAYSGNTGLSSGPHLHFEIRKENGETIDPAPYYVK
jgi:murein DD-endopeptidase MepM/ murein hydrolase activator NlpD